MDASQGAWLLLHDISTQLLFDADRILKICDSLKTVNTQPTPGLLNASVFFCMVRSHHNLIYEQRDKA
jgi:hypothetical protein